MSIQVANAVGAKYTHTRLTRCIQRALFQSESILARLPKTARADNSVLDPALSTLQQYLRHRRRGDHDHS
jgi:hypothetical protein